MYSYLLHFFSHDIVPSPFWYFRLSRYAHFHVPCLHYIFLCLFLHGLTTSVSLLEISSLMFPTPDLISYALIFSFLFIPIIHHNIIISALSSESRSTVLSTILYLRTSLMTVLCTATLRIMGTLLSHKISDISGHFPQPAPTRCLTSSLQPPFSRIVEVF